jgi:hypothetical protein
MQRWERTPATSGWLRVHSTGAGLSFTARTPPSSPAAKRGSLREPPRKQPASRRARRSNPHPSRARQLVPPPLGRDRPQGLLANPRGRRPRRPHAAVRAGSGTGWQACLGAASATASTSTTACGHHNRSLGYTWPNGPCRPGTALALSGTALSRTALCRARA